MSDLYTEEQVNSLREICPKNEDEDKIKENEDLMEEYDSLKLPQDIYGCAYFTFLRNESYVERAEVTRNVFFTFAIQALLFSLLFLGKKFVVKKESNKLKEPKIIITKMICALLLHLSMIEDISSSKEMLNIAL